MIAKVYEFIEFENPDDGGDDPIHLTTTAVPSILNPLVLGFDIT
jgi:hypothetical protein